MLALSITGASAQETVPNPYFFEVASVKPNRSGVDANYTNPGQYSVHYITFLSLLMQAFGLKRYQYVVPAWMETQRYDVVGKMPPGTTSAQRNAMLRNLLVERFRLQFHYEPREGDVYDLVVAKGGPKMQPANADETADANAPPKVSFAADGLPSFPPGSPARTMVSGLGGQTSIVTTKLSMTKLADMLSSQLQAPVSDKTGLTDNYSFLLHFLPLRGTSPLQAIDQDLAPTIHSALPSQLGLKLERHRGPIQVLVVDQAEKTPIEN